MLKLIRAATVRLFRPGGGAHRQPPAIATPLPSRPRVERPLRRARPYIWTDDGPLLRPYVLTADEWTHRREVVSAAP